jgi:hypothetical protein
MSFIFQSVLGRRFYLSVSIFSFAVCMVRVICELKKLNGDGGGRRGKVLFLILEDSLDFKHVAFGGLAEGAMPYFF